MNTPIPLQPGDHLLYGKKPKDFFGFITSLKTFSPAVHIEIYIGTGMSVASRNGIGVNSYPYREDQLIAVLRPKGNYNLDAALKWFNRLYNKKTKIGVRGRPYGWLDLLRFVCINIKTSGWICSEFAALFDKAANHYPFNDWYPAEEVDPGEFFKVREFDLVWGDKSVREFFGL